MESSHWAFEIFRKKNTYDMLYCERSRRWKPARSWRLGAAFVIFLFAFVCGIDFNLVPGAIYCIDQLKNNSQYENRTDLPDFISDTAIRRNLFGSYDWVAPLVILPTLMLTELGGAEWVNANSIKIVEVTTNKPKNSAEF